MRLIENNENREDAEINENSQYQDVPILPTSVPVTMPELPPTVNITTPLQFKAMSDPIRSKILAIIQNQPATAKQIATRLDASTGAIGHHLRVLEEAGLAKVVARRLVRGIVAKYYTRTGRIFMYASSAEENGNESAALTIVNRIREELIDTLKTETGEINAVLGFPHIRLSPERAEAYNKRFAALLEELTAEPNDPNGQLYGFGIVMFSSPKYMQGSSVADTEEDD